MMTNELKAEIKKLKNYDGPGHPDWSVQAVQTSLGHLNLSLGLGRNSPLKDTDDLVFWAFEQGIFPELSKLLVVDIDGYDWRDDVSDALCEEVAAECVSQVQIVHSYRTQRR